jgi:hypothetical protein
MSISNVNIINKHDEQRWDNYGPCRRTRPFRGRSDREEADMILEP